MPKTVPYKQVKQKQVKESVQGNGVGTGQATLDGHVGGEGEEQATNGAKEEKMDVDGDEEGTEAAEAEDDVGDVASPVSAQYLNADPALRPGHGSDGEEEEV